jgi:hypothetical protein
MAKYEKPEFAYIILASGVVDQICETKEDAFREASELRDMGERVKIVECPWDAQNIMVDKLEKDA